MFMHQTSIAEGIVEYRFPPREGNHYGFSLYALLNEPSQSALLLDTGYEEHSGAVNVSLKAHGYTVTTAVISHFHPDHILGLRALPGIDILGSPRFEETLAMHGPREKREMFVPSRYTYEGDALMFGKFRLLFLPAPGHSPCSQYTLIDEAFIHVADNVMTSNDGNDILPWAEFDRIPDHVASLERLRAFTDRTFLLSHGAPMTDRNKQNEAIDNRIRYFENALAGNGLYAYDEAVRGCTCRFLHQEWLVRKTLT
jgi:glyoxylase-like metal-dependent hydrolase (beta-lactamase superfamily II)